MSAFSRLIATLELLAVVAGWLVFALIFLAQWRPARVRERRRDRRALVGIVLQVAAFSLVWSVRRTPRSPPFPLGPVPEILLAALTCSLVLGSLWLILGAVRALGEQWSVTARLVAGHTLVTEGPYRLVRHPIYAGMLGMLLATGLAVSQWGALIAATPVYLIGTAVRARVEEGLLRQAFGAEYENYARRVPAFVPRWARP